MDKLPNVAPQLPAATRSSTPSTGSMQPSPQEVDRLRKVSRMAKRLFTAYPKSDYSDPDAAAAGMINVLKAFPLSVINQLTNETESEALQLKHKFPPRLAEIKDAADAIMSGRAQRIAYQNRVEQQLAERAAAEQPKGNRPSVAELKAKYGPTYGIDPDGGERSKAVEKVFKTMTIEELSEYYSKHPDRITKLTGPAGTR